MTAPHIDYALVLFWLTVATGLARVAEVAFRRTRLAGTRAALDLQSVPGAATPPDERERSRPRPSRAPGWIAFPAGFFPVLLTVFLLRAFLFEPFRIPSGSMVPTLRVGDLILVNKFVYGIRLPFVGRVVVPTGEPQRGDVVVFRYPLDPSENYVKRLIGLPGDTVEYRDRRLTINGRPVDTSAAPDFFDAERMRYAARRIETLPRGDGTVAHPILVDEHRDDPIRPLRRDREHCVFRDGDRSIACTVPPGMYFMLGDNRDNSADSRYWGFVPDENLVGKAVLIWMNFGDLGRIGAFP